MSAPAGAPPVRLRLRTRLALAMAALVAAAVGSSGWFTLTRVEAAFDRQFDERVAALLDSAERRFHALGERAARRIDALAADVLEDRALAGDLLIRPDPTSKRVLEAAGRMGSDLDLLQILANDGTILSSAHWFERAGLQEPAALQLPEGIAVLRHERLPAREVLAVEVRRSVALGGRRVSLVGGVILDVDLLDELATAGGEAVLLFDARGGEPLAAGEAGRLGPATAGFARRLLEDPARARGEILSAAGDAWSAGSLPLQGAGGERVGTLMVAVDRAPLSDLRARLRGTFALAGLAGGLLAVVAGGWVARRVTRPLAELVRAVDAVSAGREDYSFPRPGGDEVGHLVGSFSRMNRALRLQQEQLLAAQRVAAWREVAQRVAHEVKNPLSPIRLAVENLVKARRQAPQMFDDIFDEATGGILEEVDQLERIVTEFSEFARLPAPRPRPADLDGLVDGVLALYATEPDLSVSRRREAELPPLLLDADQISRALKNLIGNSVEAMRGRPGSLSVRTSLDGESAVLQITDSGPGFSEEARRRLFEPYFTTKETGTGLGLPIALRIISDHGGSIGAANEEGGARVTVRLPLAGPDGPRGIP